MMYFIIPRGLDIMEMNKLAEALWSHTLFQLLSIKFNHYVIKTLEPENSLMDYCKCFTIWKRIIKLNCTICDKHRDKALFNKISKNKHK